MDRRSFVKTLLGGIAALSVTTPALASSKKAKDVVASNLSMELGSLPPANPVQGTMYVDLYAQTLQVYDGTHWQVINHTDLVDGTSSV